MPIRHPEQFHCESDSFRFGATGDKSLHRKLRSNRKNCVGAKKADDADTASGAVSLRERFFPIWSHRLQIIVAHKYPYSNTNTRLCGAFMQVYTLNYPIQVLKYSVFLHTVFTMNGIIIIIPNTTAANDN